MNKPQIEFEIRFGGVLTEESRRELEAIWPGGRFWIRTRFNPVWILRRGGKRYILWSDVHAIEVARITFDDSPIVIAYDANAPAGERLTLIGLEGATHEQYRRAHKGLGPFKQWVQGSGGRPGLTVEDARDVVDRVQTARARFGTIEEACQDQGISPSWYYACKRRADGG